MACSSPLRDLAERLAVSLGAPVIRASGVRLRGSTVSLGDQ